MDSQDEDRNHKVDDEYQTFVSENEEKFLPCSLPNEKLKDTVKKSSILDRILVMELL